MGNILENCEVKIKVDLTLLRKQKGVLLSYIDVSNNDDYADMVNGLLSLIDGIQDKAIEENGFAEEDVFNLNSEQF